MALNSQLYSFHVFSPFSFVVYSLMLKDKLVSLTMGLIVFAKIQLLASGDKVQGYNYSLFLNDVFKIHSGQNRENSVITVFL